MAEQLPEREFEQRRMLFPIIFMAMGIIFLGYSIFIFVFGVGLGTTIRSSNGDTFSYGPSELTSPLRLLAQPAILMGLGLFLIGLVNWTKNHSLRRLRNTITILGMSLIGVAILLALLMLFFVLVGSALFP